MSKQQNQNIPVKSTKSASPILHPLEGVEKVFDRLVGHSWPFNLHMHNFPALDSLMEFEGSRLPKLDVIDRDKEIMVRAEVPGLDKKDIKVSINANLLTIQGQTNSEKKEEKGDYHRHEISSASFVRSVTLPGAVDASKADASLKDGVLEISLPKTESSKQHSIDVH